MVIFILISIVNSKSSQLSQSFPVQIVPVSHIRMSFSSPEDIAPDKNHLGSRGEVEVFGSCSHPKVLRFVQISESAFSQ
jgi:hypothetical protein